MKIDCWINCSLTTSTSSLRDPLPTKATLCKWRLTSNLRRS